MRTGVYRHTGRGTSLRQLLVLGKTLVLRDFRFRYRQAYLGYLWAVARPVVGVLPLILVGNAFQLGGDMEAAEYALFAMSGFLMWQMFWDAVISPQWIARRVRRVFKEVPFSPESLVAAGAGLVVFNALFYGVIFVIACLLTRTVPPPTLPLALIALPFIVLGGLAIGAFFISLTFVYLDFRFGLPLLSPLLLWTAPIIYVTPEDGVLAVINRWNPLTYLINIPREWLISGLSGNDSLFLVCALAFVVLFGVTLRFLQRSLPVAVQSLP